jgi:hypothetical protein
LLALIQLFYRVDLQQRGKTWREQWDHGINRYPHTSAGSGRPNPRKITPSRRRSKQLHRTYCSADILASFAPTTS